MAGEKRNMTATLEWENRKNRESVWSEQTSLILKKKKKTSIEKEIESEDLNEDEKDYVLFLLTILAKKVLSVMIRKRLLITFIPCV